LAPIVSRPTSNPRLGVGFMILAMALVPMIDVIAKMLAQDGMPPIQVAFQRMLCGVILFLPIILYKEPKAILPKGNFKQAFMLGFCNFGATAFFFTALKYLSIADTVAISFVQPLFVTLLSRFFLKEDVSSGRWIALFVGFIATLIIIRPSSSAFEPASLLALASGAFMALYVISVKSKGTYIPPIQKTFYTHSMALLTALPIIIWVWEPMSLSQWGFSFMLAAVGLLGQFLIIKAYDTADASLIAPLAYTEMVTSTLASWWFFKQLPDAITFLGVTILIGAAVAISWKA
jgi:drug/metabolite transporter (DMT)-like permease